MVVAVVAVVAAVEVVVVVVVVDTVNGVEKSSRRSQFLGFFLYPETSNPEGQEITRATTILKWAQNP